MAAGAAYPGRIGPNAILQPVELLSGRLGPDAAAQLAAAAVGEPRYVAPEHLVDERAVARLHALVVEALGPETGYALLAEAGARTAAYLLQHRIPRPVQGILRLLPRRAALHVLAAAMARHAWTFAGSGRFRFLPGAAPAFEIADSPLCRGRSKQGPACSFYAGVFDGLVRALVARDARVHEIACRAAGDEACRFGIELQVRTRAG